MINVGEIEPCALLMGMYGEAIIENSMVFPQKVKQNYHKTQQFHFWEQSVSPQRTENKRSQV